MNLHKKVKKGIKEYKKEQSVVNVLKSKKIFLCSRYDFSYLKNNDVQKFRENDILDKDT